jgi:hypothetical protein
MFMSRIIYCRIRESKYFRVWYVKNKNNEHVQLISVLFGGEKSVAAAGTRTQILWLSSP